MQENERRILELEATVLRQEEEKFMMREDLDWQRHENACLRSDNRALKACLRANGLDNPDGVRSLSPSPHAYWRRLNNRRCLQGPPTFFRVESHTFQWWARRPTCPGCYVCAEQGERDAHEDTPCSDQACFICCGDTTPLHPNGNLAALQVATATAHSMFTQ